MGIFDIFKKSEPVTESSITNVDDKPVMPSTDNENIKDGASTDIVVENVDNNSVIEDIDETPSIKTVCYSKRMLPKEYIKNKVICIRKWLVKDFSYVNKGDKVIEVKDTYSTYFPKGFEPNLEYIKSPYSGILVKKINSLIDMLDEGYELFKIYPDESFLLNDYPNEIEVSKDDFTKDMTIKGKLYGGKKEGFDVRWFTITFENVNSKNYLLVKYDSKELKLNKKCALHLLLDDDSVITLNAVAKPVKEFQTDYLIKYLVSPEDLHQLANRLFIKWQITNDEGIAIAQGKNICLLSGEALDGISLDLSYRVFKDFAGKFEQVVKDNTAKTVESSPRTKKADKKQESCYVYLMIDTTNNFHKIGISNHPRYREHTLQSDKPTIELLCAKEYPTRIIAEAIESALHSAFASKRIRGEWFNLSPEDIISIKQTLK